MGVGDLRGAAREALEEEAAWRGRGAAAWGCAWVTGWWCDSGALGGRSLACVCHLVPLIINPVISK